MGGKYLGPLNMISEVRLSGCMYEKIIYLEMSIL